MQQRILRPCQVESRVAWNTVTERQNDYSVGILAGLVFKSANERIKVSFCSQIYIVLSSPLSLTGSKCQETSRLCIENFFQVIPNYVLVVTKCCHHDAYLGMKHGGS